MRPEPARNGFVLIATGLALLFSQVAIAQSAPAFEVFQPNKRPASNASIDEIRQGFVRGEHSAVDIVQGYLQRSQALEPEFNALIASDQTQIERQAQQLDSLSDAEKSALLLAASTVYLKDNIDTLEYPTTAGSLALADNQTLRDAPLVAQLRAAGAIIMGKTNLSEWANFRSEQSISGWSAVGGQTGNAFDARRSPCGSSSGSAVAVALGYSTAAIGTETDGSIVCPASVNGVVGFKPTHGLVSRQGIVPLASSQDTAGPIANNVSDAARVLSAMIDPQLTEQRGLRLQLAQLATRTSLKGIRIGVLANTLEYDQRRDQLFSKSLSLIEQLGADIEPGLALQPSPEFWDDSYQVLLYEFKRDLNLYLSGLPNKLNKQTLATLIAFNQLNSDTELQLFDQGIFLKAQNLELSEEQYQQLVGKIKRETAEQGLDALFEQHDLDALIGITTGPAWMIDSINGDAFFGPSLSTYPATAGHPHITVPMGQIGGMPVGISFIGQRFNDANLAEIARAYELAHSEIKMTESLQH